MRRETWDVDKQGAPPPRDQAEREARDRRYAQQKARAKGGGGPGAFLQMVMAVLLPSTRHVVAEKREAKGVRFGNGDDDGRFTGRITLPARSDQNGPTNA